MREAGPDDKGHDWLNRVKEKDSGAGALTPGDYWVQGGAAPRDADDPFAESPLRPLYTEEQAAAMVADLRKRLAGDDSPETRRALQGEVAQGIESFRGAWFQRVEFPRHHISTTSDRRWALLDEGGLNTLGRRLGSDEASILRPQPKWCYLQPLLPDLRGKSVLEVGSSNGFFCFQFAEAGASRVTGVEIIRRRHESACWAAEVLGHENVRFLNTDFLLDLSLEAHDVVFLSEVHNHFLLPFLGLCRLVNLARGLIVLDTGIQETARHGLDLATGWDPQRRRLVYHSFQWTEGLLLDFLSLIGVPPSRVARFHAPPPGGHAVYLIDTHGLRELRQAHGYPEYLQRVMDLRFVGGEPPSG